MKRQTESSRSRSVQGLAKLEKSIRPPVAIVLGSPGPTAALVTELPTREVTCYQMDLYLAGRLRDELGQVSHGEQVVTAPDLWDLGANFETVIYPAPRGGERILKIDVVEQSFHILRPGGRLLVLSPYQGDQFFPTILKKIFGRSQTTAGAGLTVFSCQREGDRPRRRHELTFQARIGGVSLRFLSRPGVFSYGRFDEGARALMETARIEPGDRVLDLGCGCGTNGCFAAQRSQRLTEPERQRGKLRLPLLSADSEAGHITLVDSNVRAVALAGLNAASNAVASFETIASSSLEELAEGSFDVILANPPYFAHDSIARLFIERGLALCRQGGRFYLVSKQAGRIGPQVADTFGEVEIVERRGYTIFCGVR